MPLSTEKVPNLPLNGVELRQVICWLMKRECETRPRLTAEQIEKAVKSLEQSTLADSVFVQQQTWPNVRVEIAARFDRVDSKLAQKLELTCYFQQLPPLDKYSVYIRQPGPIFAQEGKVPEPPLPAPDAEHVVEAFTILMRLDNPNRARVHVGLPIRIGRQAPPEAGQIVGRYEFHDVEYSKDEYPPLPDPERTELTDYWRAQWNLPALPKVVIAVDVPHTVEHFLPQSEAGEPRELPEAPLPPLLSRSQKHPAPVKDKGGKFTKRPVKEEPEPVCRG